MSSPLSFVEADFEDIFVFAGAFGCASADLVAWVSGFFCFLILGGRPVPDCPGRLGSGTPLTVNYSGLEIGRLGNWDQELWWWWRDVDVVVVGGGSGGGGGGLVVGWCFVGTIL